MQVDTYETAGPTWWGRATAAVLVVTVLTSLIAARPVAAAETDADGDATARAAIIDGEYADANPQVVRIIVDWSDGALSSCTGAFVSSSWVLTAAHCLASAGRVPETISLESGAEWLDPVADGYWSSVGQQYRVHPGYSLDDSVVARNDLALIRSADPSPYTNPGIPYVAADLEPKWGAPEAVGILYGTGVVAPGTVSDFLRYAAFETFPAARCAAVAAGVAAQFSSDDAFCGEGFDPYGFADPEACNGDSGGPLFVLTADDQLAVGGVLSGGVSYPNCVDSTAYFVRTARHTHWIQSVTGVAPLAPVAPAPAPPPAPSTPSGSGYWLLEEDGDVTAYGGAPALGGVALAPGTTALAIAPRPQGDGFWVLASDGDVLGVGGAADPGAVDPTGLTKPGEVVSAISAAPDGGGAWVFTTAGRIISFGTATPSAQMQGADTILALTLAGPIVGSVPTPTGAGAYLVAADGGVFAVGDAVFRGSVRGELTRLVGPPGLPDQPIVGVVADPDGDGYWMVAADGGVFSFRTPFRGSLPAIVPFHQLARPVNGMVPFGNGYLLVADDGGVFNFSDQPFSGSGAGRLDTPVVGVATVSG